MHQKNREKKYYQIRVEWLWGMIFLLTVLSAAELYGILKYFRQNRTEAAPEEGQMRVEVTYDGWRSRLDDTNQCHLCGDSSRIRCESGFDAIGVISLNDWSVIDFQLRKYDTEGNDVTDDRASGILYGNTEALSWLSSGDPSRGMARISMTLPENARADEDGICKACVSPVWTRSLPPSASGSQKRKTRKRSLSVWWIFRIWNCIPYRTGIGGILSEITGWKWTLNSRRSLSRHTFCLSSYWHRETIRPLKKRLLVFIHVI